MLVQTCVRVVTSQGLYFSMVALFPTIMSITVASIRSGLVFINHNNFRRVLWMSASIQVGSSGTFRAGAVCGTGEYRSLNGIFFLVFFFRLFPNVDWNRLSNRFSIPYGFPLYVNTSKLHIK